jgi:phenylacetate-CoA ligase
MTSRRLYEQLPLWAQWVALNAHGVFVWRALSRAERLISRVVESERWSQERQRVYVEDQLRRVLAHAVRWVPRYDGLRRCVRELSDRSVSPLEVLEAFPIVTKREIAEDPKAFRSTFFNSKDLVRTQTSGSTGAAMTLWLTPEAKGLGDALWHRRAVWAGYKKGDWIARIVGDPAVPSRETSSSSPICRTSYADRRLYFSARHLTPEAIPRIVRDLNRRRPAFVMGYPSALSFIANEGLGRVPLEYRPKAVLYSSEPMHAHQHAKVAEYFRAPIRGLYGCAERVVSAAECEAGSFHLSVLDGYLEGQFAGSSTDVTGLITGLRNLGMPLIRYDLGDEIKVEHASACVCGRTLPVIAPVESRRGDAIVTQRGRHVPAPLLTLVFKDLAPIRRTQLIQESAREVHVRIDVDAQAAPEMVGIVEERVRRVLLGEMEVRVTVTTEMEATTTGKVPFVINRAFLSKTPPDELMGNTYAGRV